MDEILDDGGEWWLSEFMKVIRQLLIAWMLVAFLVLHVFGQDAKPPPPPKPLPLPKKIIPKSVADENSNKPKAGVRKIVTSSGRTITIIPPRISLDWSDFRYNSPEEKAFWDKLPDWSKTGSSRSLYSSKRNAKGEAIESNSSEGFNGYAKRKSFYERTVYQFVDGYAVREKSWYENGQKKWEINYKDGKQHGVDTAWDENGQKKWEKYYKDGKNDGLSTSWYENGQMKEEGNYKDGYFDGLYTTWYENGQKKEEGTCKVSNSSGFFFSSGSPSTYTEGLRYQANWDGLYAVWYENGQKKEESNHKGGEILSLARWGENGEKCPETDLNDGNGIVVNYHENGQKEYEYNYKDGQLDGLQTTWHKNGQKKRESNYKDGELDGLFTEWYENGQKKQKRYYKDGKLTIPPRNPRPIPKRPASLEANSSKPLPLPPPNIAPTQIPPLIKPKLESVSDENLNKPKAGVRKIVTSSGRTIIIPPRNPRPPPTIPPRRNPRPIPKRPASPEANSSKPLPPSPPPWLVPAAPPLPSNPK